MKLLTKNVVGAWSLKHEDFEGVNHYSFMVVRIVPWMDAIFACVYFLDIFIWFYKLHVTGFAAEVLLPFAIYNEQSINLITFCWPYHFFSFFWYLKVSCKVANYEDRFRCVKIIPRLFKGWRCKPTFWNLWVIFLNFCKYWIIWKSLGCDPSAVCINLVCIAIPCYIGSALFLWDQFEL